MSGYFGKLRFTATRPTNAINTRASINISPRLILEFFRGLLVIGIGIPTFNIGLVGNSGI